MPTWVAQRGCSGDNGASSPIPELSRLEAALLLAFSIQTPFSGIAV
jgi:hypothetical protein